MAFMDLFFCGFYRRCLPAEDDGSTNVRNSLSGMRELLRRKREKVIKEIIMT